MSVVVASALNDKAAALPSSASVQLLRDVDSVPVATVLAGFGIELVIVARADDIPGSYWGEPEAGVIGHRVYARDDTPVHSLLHEASHLIVAGPDRRASIHTDASDCDIEEDATCYLQIVLAGRFASVGSARLMADMDAWGYSFRLGSSRAWFERDADDARHWLVERGLLDVADAALNLAAEGRPD